MRILPFLSAAIPVAALSLAATPLAAAEEAIGESLAVVDQASATGEVGDRVLGVGTEVYLGDRVITDGQGTAQLLFDDGTRMVVGPNSELMLDQFVFRSAAAENQFAVRAIGGAFRFITGDAPKDAYLVHTPSATMGVRGTIFDFTVTPGETSFLLYQGAATVCGTNAQCETAEAAPE